MFFCLFLVAFLVYYSFEIVYHYYPRPSVHPKGRRIPGFDADLTIASVDRPVGWLRLHQANSKLYPKPPGSDSLPHRHPVFDVEVG